MPPKTMVMFRSQINKVSYEDLENSHIINPQEFVLVFEDFQVQHPFVDLTILIIS